MKENLTEVLSRLSDPDAYSVMCSFLFDLKADPKYTVLSELCYMCDKKSFLNIIKYLAGTSIKIPTAEEFSDCAKLILLFQYYEIEGLPWKEAIEKSGYNDISGRKAKCRLEKLKNTLSQYNYGNRNY